MRELRDATAIDEGLRAAWDRLADEQDLPACLSEWMLQFHSHVPGDQPLRILAVYDGHRPIGVLPLEIVRWSPPGHVLEYRLIGSLTSSRVAPLAERGREEEVAGALAVQLGDLMAGGPAFLQLEWFDSLSPWAELLHRNWPGPVVERRDGEQENRVVRLDADGDVDRWRSGYSRKFRAEIKQKTRLMERRGGTLRLAGDPSRLDADVHALFALHHARFAATDRSSSLDATHAAAIAAAAPRLTASGHMRLWLVEQGDVAVAAHLYVRAGGRMMAWNGGADPDWSRESLGMLLRHAAIVDAHRLGLREFDLGPGDNPSKQRFGNASAPLSSRSFWPLGPGYPFARARLTPKHAVIGAQSAVGRLPPQHRARLKRLLRR